jgi:hypothetical protein
MFCPKCGTPDQTENSYCRQCGEFLSKGGSAFGGVTPRDNINSISILSGVGAAVSLVIALWMYTTRFSVPMVLYLGAAILICNAAWHIANIYTVRKLASRIPKTRKETAATQPAIDAAATRELLNPADMSDHIPASVTENTTKHLSKTAKPDTSKLD